MYRTENNCTQFICKRVLNIYVFFYKMDCPKCNWIFRIVDWDYSDYEKLASIVSYYRLVVKTIDADNVPVLTGYVQLELKRRWSSLTRLCPTIIWIVPTQDPITVVKRMKRNGMEYEETGKLQRRGKTKDKRYIIRDLVSYGPHNLNDTVRMRKNGFIAAIQEAKDKRLVSSTELSYKKDAHIGAFIHNLGVLLDGAGPNCNANGEHFTNLVGVKVVEPLLTKLDVLNNDRFANMPMTGFKEVMAVAGILVQEQYNDMPIDDMTFILKCINDIVALLTDYDMLCSQSV